MAKGWLAGLRMTAVGSENGVRQLAIGNWQIGRVGGTRGRSPSATGGRGARSGRSWIAEVRCLMGVRGWNGLRALRAVLLSRSKSGTLAGRPSRPSSRHQSPWQPIKVGIKAGNARSIGTVSQFAAYLWSRSALAGDVRVLRELPSCVQVHAGDNDVLKDTFTSFALPSRARCFEHDDEARVLAPVDFCATRFGCAATTNGATCSLPLQQRRSRCQPLLFSHRTFTRRQRHSKMAATKTMAAGPEYHSQSTRGSARVLRPIAAKVGYQVATHTGYVGRRDDRRSHLSTISRRPGLVVCD